MSKKKSTSKTIDLSPTRDPLVKVCSYEPHEMLQRLLNDLDDCLFHMKTTGYGSFGADNKRRYEMVFLDGGRSSYGMSNKDVKNKISDVRTELKFMKQMLLNDLQGKEYLRYNKR